MYGLWLQCRRRCGLPYRGLPAGTADCDTYQQPCAMQWALSPAYHPERYVLYGYSLRHNRFRRLRPAAHRLYSTWRKHDLSCLPTVIRYCVKRAPLLFYFGAAALPMPPTLPHPAALAARPHALCLRPRCAGCRSRRRHYLACRQHYGCRRQPAHPLRRFS